MAKYILEQIWILIEILFLMLLAAILAIGPYLWMLLPFIGGK